MYSRDYRDIVSGGLLAAFGLWYSWYSYGHYSIGTFARMGDGMFPVALGLLLAVFGLVIAILGLTKTGPKVHFDGTTAFFILLGISGFAVVVAPFGLVPAIVTLTVLSSFADIRKFRALTLLVLCAVLSVMAYAIFQFGLGLVVPMFNWPF